MKSAFYLLTVLALAMFTACETDQFKIMMDDADLLLNKNEYDRAIASYDAIKSDQSLDIPDSSLAGLMVNRGIANIKKGSYNDAIDDLNEAIRLKDDFAKAFANRGIAYDHINNYQNAIADYKKALELDKSLGEPPSLFRRIIHNIQEFTTIADRLKFLEETALTNNSDEEESTQPTSSTELPLYSKEATNCNEPSICSYDIRIDQKLSTAELAAIATSLRDNSPDIEQLDIVYYLPCMKLGNGGWAISNFNSTSTVIIQDEILESNPACLGITQKLANKQ
ncbi:MAG: tetratricopeptide repeat protein [Nitrospinota bacterium]